MVREIKELLQNANLYLRLAECIACLVGMVLFLADISTFWSSYIWLIHGWFIASIAFIVSYVFEQPNFGTEVILIGLHFIPMMESLTKEYSNDNLCPVVTGILMIIDLFFLIGMREK